MFDFGLYTQVSDSGPHGPLVFWCFFFVDGRFSIAVSQFFSSLFEHLFITEPVRHIQVQKFCAISLLHTSSINSKCV